MIRDVWKQSIVLCKVHSNHFRFSTVFKKACSLPLEDVDEQRKMIEDVVKESIVIEWPRTFPGVYSDQAETELDFAPLIHRARNVVKCRTSHPTMRVK